MLNNCGFYCQRLWAEIHVGSQSEMAFIVQLSRWWTTLTLTREPGRFLGFYVSYSNFHFHFRFNHKLTVYFLIFYEDCCSSNAELENGLKIPLPVRMARASEWVRIDNFTVVRSSQSQLAEPVWTSPGLKSRVSVARVILHFKKKKKKGGGGWIKKCKREMNGRTFSQSSRSSRKWGEKPPPPQSSVC